MTDLPEPLTPAGLDLTAFPFMPLHVMRLRDSRLAAKGTAEGNWYAVILWCAAWHQVPAGSLPDDEDELTKLCGLGRDVETFRRLRVDAMRNFVLCNDGRWYHPTVSEEALKASTHAVSRRDVVDARETRQERWRRRVRQIGALLRERGITPPAGASLSTLQELCERHQIQIPDLPARPKRDAAVDGGETSPETRREMSLTGTGTIQGHIPPTPVSGVSPASQSKPDRELPMDPWLEAVIREGGMVGVPPDIAVLKNWKDQGCDLNSDVLPAVRMVAKHLKDKGSRTPFRLKVFDAAVRELFEDNQRQLEHFKRVQRNYSDGEAATT